MLIQGKSQDLPCFLWGKSCNSVAEFINKTYRLVQFRQPKTYRLVQFRQPKTYRLVQFIAFLFAYIIYF